tara:strand:- start:369 stop:530 length:162 start_codon:yes stop_codon:yes gene_type:complete
MVSKTLTITKALEMPFRRAFFEKKANAEGSTKVQERVESRMGCSLSMPISQVV